MRDVSNALASCNWMTTCAANMEITPEDLRDLGEQRHRGATFRTPCRGDENGACIKPHCGGLIGDPVHGEGLHGQLQP
eukprot:8103983-Pyramimonas_sp.AAC.1